MILIHCIMHFADKFSFIYLTTAETVDVCGTAALPLVVAVETRWKLLCEGLRVEPAAVVKWWVIIRDHYSESHRHYHTLAHVLHMLRQLDSLCRGQLRNTWEVELATFFHEYAS